MAVSNVSTVGGDTWQLLNTTTISSSTSSVSVSLGSATYKRIGISLIYLVGDTNHRPRIRFNNDSGNNYTGSAILIDGANLLYGVWDILWLGAAQNQNTWGVWAEFENCDQVSAKYMKAIATSGAPSINGAWLGSDPVSSIQFYPTAGNWTSGTIKIYGIPS